MPAARPALERERELVGPRAEDGLRAHILRKNWGMQDDSSGKACFSMPSWGCAFVESTPAPELAKA